jgi:hypothetical protein
MRHRLGAGRGVYVENVTEFNELYLGAAAAILDKYIAEITQAKLGN